MAYLSDIEIAQSCTPKHITEIAKVAGVDEKYLELYGSNKAKVDYALLNESEEKEFIGFLGTVCDKVEFYEKI